MSCTATKAEWDIFKDQINMLYIKENRQLEGHGGVIEVMQKRFSFTATKAQYESRLKKWGMWKYAKGVSDNDWQIMLYKFESRRSKTGKEPQVYRLGKRITPRVIRSRGFMKYTERNALEQAPSPRTPPEFSIHTPSFSRTSDLDQYTSSRPENIITPAAHISPMGNINFMSGQDSPSEILFTSFSHEMDVDYPTSMEGNPLVSIDYPSPIRNINITSSDEFSSDTLFAGLSDSVHLGYVTSPGGGIILDNGSSELDFTESSLFTRTTPGLEICRSLSPEFQAPYFGNLPWSLFRKAIERNTISHHMTPRLSPGSSSLWIRNGQQKISVARLPELLLDGVSSLSLTAIFEGLIPKRLDGELINNVHQFLDTSCPLYIYQLIELFMALISNNVITRKSMRRFLYMVVKHNPTDLLRELFSINTPTIQAVLTRILETIAEDGEGAALNLLLDAGIDQGNLAGARGGRLLQLATHAGRIEVAKVLLRCGADVNPILAEDISYEPFSLPPLHHAIQKDNPELVNCLLKAGANVEWHDEFGETALSHAIAMDSPKSVELLLSEGAVVDTCKVSDGREIALSGFSANLDAIDYAYLNSLRTIYELLLPYSQKAREHITTHGVLHAAKEGSKALQTYLDSRTRIAGKSQKVMLEEALVLTLYHSGPAEVTRTLLDFGVDPNVPTHDTTYKDHPLISAMRNDISVFKYLVAAGAKIDDQRIVNAAAEEEKYVPILDYMIQSGVNLDNFGADALVSGVYYKNLSAVKLLIGYGVDLNKCNMHGMYPIQEAAHSSSYEMVEYLLRNKADPNAPPCREEERTALHYAVYNRDLEMAQLLIGFGARITPPEPQAKLTILETLCTRISAPMTPKERRLFEFLLDAGADIHYPRPENRPNWCSPVLATLIRQSADCELIRRVLDAGADVNEAGTSGYTAIQAAAARGHLELLKELYNRGADINARAGYSFGRTALQAACSGNEINTELVAFLLDNGADVNAEAGVKWGLTALQGAAIEGHIGLASLLQERGADVNAPPAIFGGRTALEGAAEHGRLDMVQLLLNFGGKDERGGYDGAIKRAEENGHWAVVDLLNHHRAS
ncbi:ankyrin repeat-containing domain protein [Xylaria scruposa]|nr:ankyrin repeat-containing domain protein [Xylaria scruposa]